LIYYDNIIIYTDNIRGKNDFVEGSKILLATDLKIILLELPKMSNAAKKFFYMI